MDHLNPLNPIMTKRGRGKAISFDNTPQNRNYIDPEYSSLTGQLSGEDVKSWISNSFSKTNKRSQITIMENSIRLSRSVER